MRNAKGRGETRKRKAGRVRAIVVTLRLAAKVKWKRRTKVNVVSRRARLVYVFGDQNLKPLQSCLLELSAFVP